MSGSSNPNTYRCQAQEVNEQEGPGKISQEECTHSKGGDGDAALADR